MYLYRLDVYTSSTVFSCRVDTVLSSVKVGYDHCIVGTYSNLDIIYPSTATDRQPPGLKEMYLSTLFLVLSSNS